MDFYQEFIYKSRYARWKEEDQRREIWNETIDRYYQFFLPKVPEQLIPEFESAIELIRVQSVMPAMRCLMTAGPALERDNAAGYNCYYRAIRKPYFFAEIMYVLMCGAGAGFSVERQYICDLPEVPELTKKPNELILQIEDSKYGWCRGLYALIMSLYLGVIPEWDLSKVRPAGARLKTFGGRSSGPESLDGLYQKIVNIFLKASGQGRKLNSVECHDLLCYIAETVVVGGVRRSAMLSLSNLTDERMRNAKNGEWSNANSQRSYANNSVCYTERPDVGIFLREWQSLYESHAGERGIFSRPAAQRKAKKSGRRDPNYDFGTNPCGEVILRDGQFCNLTEVIIRPDDLLEDLIVKAEAATILGTLQATLTDFTFLSEDVKVNCEKERLLGVSLTGIMDHPLLSQYSEGISIRFWLERLKEAVYATNNRWADALHIPRSAAATTICLLVLDRGITGIL